MLPPPPSRPLLRRLLTPLVGLTLAGSLLAAAPVQAESGPAVASTSEVRDASGATDLDAILSPILDDAAPRERPATPPAQRALVKTDPDFVDIPTSCQEPDGQPIPRACWQFPDKKKAPIIFLWGDSHGWQMIPPLRAAVRGRNVNLVSWTAGGCTPMLTKEIEGRTNGCVKFGNLAIDWLKKKKRQGREVRVVYAASWELYHNIYAPPNAADERFPGFKNDWIRMNAWTSRYAMPRAFRELGRLGIPTDLVGQMPMVWTDAPDCPTGEFQCDLPRWGVIKDARENNARIDAMRKLLTRGGRVIRPAKMLCTTQVCRGRQHGIGVYIDQLHVGQRTSVRFAPLFKPTVDDAIKQGQRAKKKRRR